MTQQARTGIPNRFQVRAVLDLCESWGWRRIQDILRVVPGGRDVLENAEQARELDSEAGLPDLLRVALSDGSIEGREIVAVLREKKDLNYFKMVDGLLVARDPSESRVLLRLFEDERKYLRTPMQPRGFSHEEVALIEAGVLDAKEEQERRRAIDQRRDEESNARLADFLARLSSDVATRRALVSVQASLEDAGPCHGQASTYSATEEHTLEGPSPDEAPVFISYARESPAHEKKVLDLAQRLRQEGVVCGIDQFVNGAPREGWPLWMERQIDAAAFVLVVCTETYLQRYDAKENSGKGLGATWEAVLTRQDLYEGRSLNEKFVPVIFQDKGGPSAVESFDPRLAIPKPLRPYTYYRLPAGYDDLYRYLTGQPKVVPNPVGKKKNMPTLSGPTAGQQIEQSAESSVQTFRQVGRPPASASSAKVTITVHAEDGEPIGDADVLLVASNGTYLRHRTDKDGKCLFNVVKSQTYSVFSAHHSRPANLVSDFDASVDMTVTVPSSPGAGSLVSIRNWAAIPGLQGAMNPIHDAQDRLYLYTKNIAVDGGRRQPVPFQIGKALHLEDAEGNEVELTFVAVIGDCFLAEYRSKYVTERVDARTNDKSREVIDAYRRHFAVVRPTSSPGYICQQAGKVFDELSRMNQASVVRTDHDEFDHALVFMIAGWIKDNVNNEFVFGVARETLADGITKQILAYLATASRPEDLSGP